MKFILSVLFTLTLISCTKKSETVSQDNPTSPASSELIHQDLPDPSQDIAASSAPSGRERIEIDVKDRSCKKDSDCTIVPVQCSCDCGEGVNKSHAEKYRTRMTDLCEKEKNQKTCKKICDGQAKCVDKLCAYVY